MITFLLGMTLLVAQPGAVKAPAQSGAVAAQAAVSAPDFERRLDSVLGALQPLESVAATPATREVLMRVYLDQYEALEGLYGNGAGQADALTARIVAGETAFHAALQATPQDFGASMHALIAALRSARELRVTSGRRRHRPG